MLYDKDIREPLFDFLEETYGKIRIIEEKSVGRSRADVVMVLPDALCGLEIKSDADTYARLSRQVKDYNQYFDYNYIVACAPVVGNHYRGIGGGQAGFLSAAQCQKESRGGLETENEPSVETRARPYPGTE